MNEFLPIDGVTTRLSNTELETFNVWGDIPKCLAIEEPCKLLYSADGTLQACNRRAEELLGLKFEQMQKLTASDIFGQAIDGINLPFTQQSHPILSSLQLGKPSQNQLMGLQLPKGKLVWLLVDSQPLYRGNNSGLYGVTVSLRKFEGQQSQLGLCNRALSYTQQQSDRQLRTVLDSLMNFVGILTPDGILIEANRTALDAAGLQAEEVLNRPFEETYWWSYDPKIQAQLREAIDRAARGDKVRYDVKIRLGEGKFIIIDFALAPIFDERGQISYLIPSGIDITERKQAEAKLIESEEFNRSIFENSADCVKVLDKEGRLISMNGPGMGLMEIDDINLVIGQIWVNFWQEPYRSAAQEAILVARSGEIGHFEGFCPTAKGTPKWWDVLVAAVPDHNGEVKRYVSASRDITDNKRAAAALKASEAKLRSFVDSNALGVILSDIYGGIHEANDKFLEMVGYTREELHNGRMRWMEMTPPEFLPRDEKHIAEAKIKGACTPYEKEYLHKDGRRIPVSIGYALVGENREEAVAFIIDLTEQKKVEAERDRLLAQEKAARTEAERANRIKDEFLAVLSHELRTPLNPILGWSKLLQSGRLNPQKAASAIEIIERNAKLQAQLIEDLLDVSCILQGKLSLNISQVNPSAAVLGALDTVKLAAEAKEIEIHTEIDENTGSVLGDVSRLQQVVWNLLSNAVKFTSKGGRICLSLTQEESCIKIQVTDTGKGISSDFLPYVFDYFRQADSATTRQFGGLGLGLAIVKQIVELHGGRVSAESSGEGKGTTFTVKLPLQPLATKCRNDEGGKLTSEVQLQPLAEHQVLVVDDDPDSREMIGFILEQEGAQITSLPSAKEALKALASSHFDLLVSDIGMPEMDGYMLLKRLRALPPEKGGGIPAIALTAYAGEYDRQRAIAAGFQQHLAKPIEPYRLIEIAVHLIKS